MVYTNSRYKSNDLEIKFRSGTISHVGLSNTSSPRRSQSRNEVETAAVNEACVSSLPQSTLTVVNTESKDGFDNITYYGVCLAQSQ